MAVYCRLHIFIPIFPFNETNERLTFQQTAFRKLGSTKKSRSLKWK